jgi:hypothetical protein
MVDQLISLLLLPNELLYIIIIIIIGFTRPFSFESISQRVNTHTQSESLSYGLQARQEMGG